MPLPSRRDRADAIRFLSIDAVQQANSGHPGMPMGMADIAEVLWHDFLHHNPQDPQWFNRDRFVLSNGHGSMLLYALLHLTGYELSIDDLKQFRQLHSKTPGHPEYGLTPGVETTTGPLGQGFANAVGMAIAEKHLAAIYNRPNFPIIDHYTYCFVGDGCLMEGISHEVASLAGTLKLNKLIFFYDDNGISIDGEVNSWFTDDTPQRFQAYGWHVIADVDGHDSAAIHTAINTALQVTDKPILICCKTTIGWGSPNLAGMAVTHGAALGEQEIAAVRTQLNWPHIPFTVPEMIYQAWDARQKGASLQCAWQALYQQYQQRYPQLAQELTARLERTLPPNWQAQVQQLLSDLNAKQPTMATRKASQQCLNYFAPDLPFLLGGSADLTESNCTNWQGMQTLSATHPQGRYLHYGVREFGMSAIMNGLALHRAIVPFGGTFLTFSDYARNAVRLSALMQQQVIYIYSHDSIGLGEDGPTHQPIEHIPSLRMMPGLSVWRPCDAIETVIAWQYALEHKGPTCLLLSRQNLPFQQRSDEQIGLIKHGAYILVDYAKQAEPDAIIMATGSEVQIAVTAAHQLAAENIRVRVISMPAIDVFLKQPLDYQQALLPPSVLARVAIEAAASDYWYRFVGLTGQVLGIDRYGASAPAPDVFRDCGLTVENLVAVTQTVIANNRKTSTINLQPVTAKRSIS